MELKEAIEILKNTYYYPTEMKRTQEAVETVLQVLTIPDNNDVCFVGGGRTKGRTLTRTYEFGLIVGTKRERVYWEDKIKKKIKQMNTEEKIKLKKLGGTDRYLTKLEYMHKENVLEDLLKEE